MKFVLRILFSISVTLLFFQCTSKEVKREQLIDFLPGNTSEILKFKNLDATKTSLFNPKTGITLVNDQLYKCFYNNNILTNALVPGNESNLYFNIDKDSIPAYTFVTTYSDSIFKTDGIGGITIDTIKNKRYKLFKNQLDTTVVYTAIKDSFFLASSSHKNIVDLLTLKTTIDPSLQKIENLHTDAPVVLLKQNISLSDNETPYTGWTSLKSNISENGYAGTGVTILNDSLPQLLSAFKGQIPQPLSLETIAPREMLSATAFTLNDAEQFLKNVIVLNDSLTESKELELLDSAIELGSLQLKSGEAYYLKSLDALATTEALAIRLTQIERYRNIQLYDIDNPSFISSEIAPLLPDVATNIYFTIDDYCLFTENIATAQEIISAYINNDVLSQALDYQEVKSAMTSASSYTIIERGDAALTTISDFLDISEIAKPTGNHNAITSLQFSIEGNYAHTTVNYKSVSPKKKVSAGVTEQFRTTLDTPFKTTPLFFRHQSGTNVIIQDDSNVLQMLSSDGKSLWKKELDGPILGKVAHIDIRRNNRKQLAFVTQNSLYVITNQGKDVGPFPIKFRDKITQPLAVFDYENKRKYRFLITQSNRLYMYDSNAKIVKGFTFKQTASPIKHIPKHIRIGNKDYIVITEDNGKLHLLSRTGKERVNTKDIFNFSHIPVQKEGNSFIVITTNNEKKTITTQGKVSTQKLNISDAYSFQMFGRTKITLDDYLLRINGILIELPLGVYTQPQLMTHKGKQYILITETQENKIYLYNKDRKLVNGFPIYGSEEATMAYYKNDLLITTKGDDNELLLYSIR